MRIVGRGVATSASCKRGAVLPRPEGLELIQELSLQSF